MLAAQGTDLAGSPTDILGDAAADAQSDVLAMRTKRAREVWRHRANGIEFGNDVALTNSKQATTALSLGDVGASLIASGGAVMEKWHRFNRKQ